MRILHRWIFVAVCVAGCGSNNDANQRINDTQIVNGQAHGADLSNQFVSETSGNDAATLNGKIAGVVQSINQGEIAEAQFVMSITNLGPITDYTNLEVSDHVAAQQTATMVVRDIGTGFIASATSTSIDSQIATEIASLRASADPNFEYLEDSVMDHESFRVLVEQMLNMTTNAELQSFLNSFDLLMIAHRDRASFLLISF
jgi:hypothetical protein